LVTAMMVSQHHAPWLTLVFMGALAIRAVALLCGGTTHFRARTVGMGEAIVGVVFVFGLALAW
jgi:hypothetical protein